MFLGLEAIDEEGLRKYRKRISLGKAFEALEFARSLGIMVAINLIADPEWDRERFAVVRQWCMEIPEIVNISVNTPYPGTETWHTEARRVHTRDYRLYDIQHAVLPTKLPLPEFYAELIKTQRVLATKHLGWAAFKGLISTVAGQLARGQTNFVRSLWKFGSVYDPALHARRPQPARHLRDEAAAAAEGDGRSEHAVRAEGPRPLRAGHRRGHRAVRRGHADGNERVGDAGGVAVTRSRGGEG